MNSALSLVFIREIRVAHATCVSSPAHSKELAVAAPCIIYLPFPPHFRPPAPSSLLKVNQGNSSPKNVFSAHFKLMIYISVRSHILNVKCEIPQSTGPFQISNMKYEIARLMVAFQSIVVGHSWQFV